MDLREALTIAGGVFGLVGVYVALDRRVTRMEAIEHRVQTMEAAVLTLTNKASTLGEGLARVAAQLEALSSTVEGGIEQVLAELRSGKADA